MFTSCGWFFDDVAGLEGRQVLQYAGRAIELAERLCGPGFEGPFLERLADAQSNDPARGDGRRVYEDFVLPARVTLDRVGAHYAVSALFEDYDETAVIYCYRVAREGFTTLSSGRARLAYGRALVASTVTGEEERLGFCVLHLGDQNVSGGVGRFGSEDAYGSLVQPISEAFRRGELATVLRLLDQNFAAGTYSLKLLFRDEQRKIVRKILEETLSETDAAYRQLYEKNAPLLRFLHERSIRLPRALSAAAELALTAALRRALEADPPDLAGIEAALSQAEGAGVRLPEDGLGYAFARTLERLAEAWRARPEDGEALGACRKLAGLASSLPFRVDFWKAQNILYEILVRDEPRVARQAAQADAAAAQWLATFRELADRLAVFVPD